MNNFKLIHELAANYDFAAVDRQIAPGDTMVNEWYFSVGQSAVQVVMAACMASRLTEVKRVLDLPCGYGRVLRHLVKLFPRAEIDVCDIEEPGVAYCASRFGARPIPSRPELTEVDFGARYDVIWVGSLFTHLPLETTKRWMNHLARFLSPTGIVVATVHGRWSEYVHKVAPYIGEDRWKGIVQEFRACGYGFRDYHDAGSEAAGVGQYGISLAKPSTIIAAVEEIPGVRIYLYLERGWADHQDVIVYGRPSFDEAWVLPVRSATASDPIETAAIRLVDTASTSAQGRPLVVYGAGGFGRKVLDVCRNRSLSVGAWFDSDPGKTGMVYDGAVCLAPTAVVDHPEAVFVAASLQFSGAMAVRIGEEFAAVGKKTPVIVTPFA